MDQATDNLGQRLGRGRSAIVYRCVDDTGHPYARKVFVGDAPSKVVHLVLNGAPNPYTWNDDAIATAVGRRRLLDALVTYWFDDRLRLPKLLGHNWDATHRAHAIDMELITGRPAALHQPFSGPRGDELRDLRTNIMRPLQGHLRDSGFVGLMWQAGWGNPVATSNFMIDSGAGEPRRWVWVDLESGVPALFPLNPMALVSLYLPASIKAGGPLFDDVEPLRLLGYLHEREGPLTDRFGVEQFETMTSDAETIAAHQAAWRATPRVLRSVTYALKRGRIDAAQADWYADRPARWYSRLTLQGTRAAGQKLRHGLAFLRAKLTPKWLATCAVVLWRFLFSQAYRAEIGRKLVVRRIDAWAQRKQLTEEEAGTLRDHVQRDEATVYITDFGVHLALKPPTKFTVWVILPALVAAGVISLPTAGIGIAIGGAVGRTAYTLYRFVQMTLRGREKPWVALVVGVLPVVGNAAYPMQIMYTSTERDHDVARFVMYDLFTSTGRLLPIWGGADTGVEHFFNRWPTVLLRANKRDRVRRGAAAEKVAVSA